MQATEFDGLEPAFDDLAPAWEPPIPGVTLEDPLLTDEVVTDEFGNPQGGANLLEGPASDEFGNPQGPGAGGGASMPELLQAFGHLVD